MNFGFKNLCKPCNWMQTFQFRQLGGGCGGTSPPPPARNDLWFSNTTGILQSMQICMICILSSSHYVIAQSKVFFLVFAIKIISLCHQSVMPFLNGAPPPKKNPGSTPEIQLEVRKGLNHGIGLQDKVKFQQQHGLVATSTLIKMNWNCDSDKCKSSSRKTIGDMALISSINEMTSFEILTKDMITCTPYPRNRPQLWHADHWTTLPAINNSEFRQQDSRKERTAKWWVSQRWRGYYLQEKRVLSGIHLTCFLLFYQKICLKVCEV